MGCCKCKLFAALVGIAFLATVAYLPDTQEYFGFDIDLTNKGVTNLPESFSGPLLANQLLNKAEHLFQNELHGPEAFAQFNGKIYTGVSDGRIVEILEQGYRTVALLDPKKVGQAECSKIHKRQCGRPLGLRFDSRGTLYAADPHYGIFAINVHNGDIKLILDAGKIGAKFLDDLVLLEKPNGGLVIYVTDVSTRWSLYQATFCVAEHDRTGRLLRFDTETQKLTVEYENLAFPNGLELTDDKSAILMASINDRLVYKYYIKGEKAGQLVTFIDNLPGEPDNIKRSADKSRETYWVGLYTGRNKHNPHYTFDVFGNKYPILKRFTVRLQRLIGFVAEKLANLVQCDCFARIAFTIKAGHLPSTFFSCKYGMAVEVDANGRIVSSMHSPDGRTCALSEVFELEEKNGERRFLLGSAHNAYLGRLSVAKDEFPRGLEQSQERPKVTEEVKPKQTKEQVPQKPKASTQPKASNEPKKSEQVKSEKHDEL